MFVSYKMIDQKIMIGAGVLVVLIVLYFFFFRKNGAGGGSKKKEDAVDSNGTVYGTMTCPYTVKQREKYPDYKFVDCSAGKCPEFVSAFPTTKHLDGKVEVGFS